MAMTMAQGFALFSTRSTQLFLSKEYTNRGRRNEGRKRVRACLGSANMLCTSMPKKRSLIEKHQVKKTQDKSAQANKKRLERQFAVGDWV